MKSVSDKNKTHFKTYTPESQLKHPFKFLLHILYDLSESRSLAWQLTIRDIKGQYRQSILGIVWAFLLPLANTITWIFLNKSGIIRLDSTGIPYPLFVFSGTLLWSIFIESMQAPLKLTTAAKSMLSKINFPKEAIIISGIYQSMFNGLIKALLIIIVFVSSGIYPGVDLLLFPFAFFSLILSGTAIGLLLTPIGLLYTDIGRAVPIVMQFFMYISPVVYPIPSSGWVRTLFFANPLTHIIIVCRDWISGMSTQHLSSFILVNIIMLFILIVSLIIYKMVMPILIERMSA